MMAVRNNSSDILHYISTQGVLEQESRRIWPQRTRGLHPLVLSMVDAFPKCRKVFKK